MATQHPRPGRDHIRAFVIWLQGGEEPCPHWLPPKGGTGEQTAPSDRPACEGYGKGYINNLARCVQQYSHWLAEEEDLPEMFDRRVKVPPAPKYDVDQWLDKGGAEGDLMELTGWESTQMLQRYGRAVRSRRVQRSYDRVMGEMSG